MLKKHPHSIRWNADANSLNSCKFVGNPKGGCHFKL